MTYEPVLAALGDWRAGGGPLFERLTIALVRAAQQGALPGGGELPPERALAAELGVSRATVAAAYRELRDRGLAVTRHGSGTVIRSVLPPPGGASSPTLAGLLARASETTAVIDLSVGAPDFDELVAGLELDGTALAGQVEGHGYAPLGWPTLRAAVAECLSRRGATTSPEEVLITNGAQEAIALAVGIAAGDGRRIAVESPGYPGALDAIVRAGGQPVAVPRDSGGLRVDSLKRLIEDQHLHALYVGTSVNNPTGGKTAAHRRERLAALAAEHDFTIVEDVVLDELRYDGEPGPPLWSLAPERVLAAGSLSKVAWGGLRVGWLRAPRPVVLRLARVKGALNLGVGAFDQLAALELLKRYDEICVSRRRQAEAHMRAMHDALARELPDWPVEPAEGGWSLWVPLPSGSAAAFAQLALRHGVAVAPGGASSPDQDFPDCVRVCFGPAPPLLEEAARRLAAAWSEFVPAAAPVTTLTGT